jgi:hypothetical protein
MGRVLEEFRNRQGKPYAAIFLPAAVLILLALSLPACKLKEEASVTTPTEVTASKTMPPPTSTRPAEIVITGTVEIPEILPTIPLPGQKVLETEHFNFYVEDGYRPVDLEQLARTAEDIYADVSADMAADTGAESPNDVILSFQPPEERSCPARGMTLFAEPGPRVIIFADEQTGEAQIQGVLAHELVHVIHSIGFDRSLGGDRNLTEGLATWFSRDYWTAWHQTESLEEMVRGYLAAGEYVPLAEADVFTVHPQAQGSNLADCLDRRDLLYTQWASFVGYLVDTYGWEAFLDLLASAASEVNDEGAIMPSPTDYQGLYGKSLDDLEEDWLSQVQANT